ncbi:hypothetical protein CEXT_143981 [Caerostris extrusa]|uniref:Uncharacterized protein n=1 Tax=Caerostris extrusa TaxID=172846 RepID=A0AAV4NYX9_CAEEX|nr:hypothetical protein CEXT_143981 [Caerostris extrusa]
MVITCSVMEGGVYLVAGAIRQSQQLCSLSLIEDRPLVGEDAFVFSKAYNKRLGGETARLIEICLLMEHGL